MADGGAGARPTPHPPPRFLPRDAAILSPDSGRERSPSLVSLLAQGAHGYSVFLGRFVPSPPFICLIAYRITDAWVFIAF